MPASSSVRRPIVQYMNGLKRIDDLHHLLAGPRTSRSASSSLPLEYERAWILRLRSGQGPAACPELVQGSGENSRRQSVKLRHVVVQDALPELGRQMRRLLGDHVLAPRPGRIAVREVGCPHELVRIELVGELKSRPVILEGEPDVFAKVFRRQA